jgi:hypothetical protein
VQNERINVRSEFGDDERDPVRHQPGNEVHISRKPIELADGNRAAYGAGFCQSG